MKATNRLITCVAGVSLSCGAPDSAADIDARQAAVAEIGATVMPFDLDTSTHVFTKTPTGGLQQVVSDSNDPEQIGLIRAHLTEEATRFSAGDFHHPGMIHGEDMAGLHDLMNGYERMSIAYREIDAGAEILYTTEDAPLVTAIHAWFDAQLQDHGEHAKPHR